jgi:translation initiation factor IF-3
VNIGRRPATLNICGIHCCTPSFGKKRQKYVKDAAQNEADAVLSAQKSAKIESLAVQLRDEHGADLGVMKKKTAEQRAKDEGLKLVCVDGTVRPIVYRLMTGADLVKFDKEQKRIKKENAPKDQKTVRLSMGIGPRDLEMKLKHADEWVVKGHSVYVSLKSSRGMSLVRKYDH